MAATTPTACMLENTPLLHFSNDPPACCVKKWLLGQTVGSTAMNGQLVTFAYHDPTPQTLGIEWCGQGSWSCSYCKTKTGFPTRKIMDGVEKNHAYWKMEDHLGVEYNAACKLYASGVVVQGSKVAPGFVPPGGWVPLFYSEWYLSEPLTPALTGANPHTRHVSSICDMTHLFVSCFAFLII